MERLDLKLTEPRRKKCRAKRAKALPVPTKNDENDETESQPEIKICFGHLKDKSIFVNDLDEIKHLYLSGLFSKGAPETLEFYCADEYSFLRSGTNKNQSKDREKDLKHEPLVLSLCEAFYLSHVFGILVVEAENGELMSLKKMWRTFGRLDKSFVVQYTAYHHFRNKGWVVRSGVKYGVDFVVLYKEGPPFYHSSYSVLVCPTNADDSESGLATLPSNWTEMSCLVRVTEQVAKELLACIILKPPSVNSFDSPTCVDEFKIFEVVIRRWVSKKEREDPDAEEAGH